MKYIKTFEYFKSENKIDINNEDELLNYILGEDETLEESISDVISRLKKVAKRGLLTATLFASLTANAAFVNEWKTLDNKTKSEITNLIQSEDSESVVDSVDVEKSNDKYVIKLGKNFKSAHYEIKGDALNNVMKSLDNIKEFLNKNNDSKINNIVVTIISSESNVPNYELDGKTPLPKGELAKRRLDFASNLLNKYLKDNGLSQYVRINPKMVKPTLEYKKGDNPKDFEADQFVDLEITTEICPLCGVIANERVIEQGTEENKYITFDESYTLKDSIKAETNVRIETGTIPDRMIAKVNGEVVYDSGFLATETDKAYSSTYKYIPAYVLGLTNNFINGDECMENTSKHKVNVVKVDSFEELESIILQPGKTYKKTDYKHAKQETLRAMYLLKKLYDTGQREFALYELDGNNSVKMDLSKLSGDTVNIKVYSPLFKTKYLIKGDCKEFK